MNISSGEKLWDVKLGDEKDDFVDGFFEYINEASVIRMEQGIMGLGAILSSPVVEHNIVYFGSTDGYLYALKIK